MFKRNDDRKGTLYGVPVVYVSRPGGGHTAVPVDEDGFVPIDALMEHHMARDPGARMMDDTQTAKTVRPMVLTPRQAAGWWRRPGRSDIQGIDCPKSTPVTVKPKKSRKASAEKTVYYPINEEAAKQAVEVNSMTHYIPGQETDDYRREVDKVRAMAEELKANRDKTFWPEIDEMTDEYARRLADWINRRNVNRASHVSITVAGPSGYNNKRRDRQNAAERRLMEEYQVINALPERMRGIGNPLNPVSLRDKNAALMLDIQIDKAEREHKMMKDVNAYWRRHGTLIGCPQIPEPQQLAFEKAMREPGRESDKPFQDYDIALGREKVKRLREKKKELERSKGRGSSSYEIGDIRVEEDSEDMVIRVIFPEKPSEQIRSILKLNGFRWSPKAGAWQRTLDSTGKQRLTSAMKQIARIEGYDLGPGGD